MLEFKLTVEEANIVIASLKKQPFEIVAGVIANIQRQANDQLNPKKTEEQPKSKKA